MSQRAGNDWAQFTVGNTEIGLFGELATPPHQSGALSLEFYDPDGNKLGAIQVPN